MNNQKGFVIEGLAIVILSLAVGLFGGLMTDNKAQKAKIQHQQQQIDTIKAGGLNDGKVDW